MGLWTPPPGQLGIHCTVRGGPPQLSNLAPAQMLVRNVDVVKSRKAAKIHKRHVTRAISLTWV